MITASFLPEEFGFRASPPVSGGPAFAGWFDGSIVRSFVISSMVGIA
jgi:hypothetical protein